MFNLLVSGAGWQPSSDSISASRVLEYTEAAMRERFAPHDRFDISGVLELPTIFASETSFDNSQAPARIGALTRVRLSAGDYQLNYVLDSDLPPIPNAVLKQLARELDIDVTSPIHEFSRTHWSIKDRDLFRVLFRHNIGRRQTPKAFTLRNEAIDERLVAVMMPFEAKFDSVYLSLQEAATAAGMRLQRADDIWIHDHVIDDVVSLIGRAKVVICDLTGRNPNVFYEMGIAHTLARDVIMLAQNKADVPFDVGHIRYIQYFPNSEGLKTLANELRERLGTLQVRG